MSRNHSHEDLNRQEEIKGSSNRSFGLVFAAVFLLIALYPLLAGNRMQSWAIAISAGFLVLALFSPAWLAYPNRLWLCFGLLLNAIVSPVAMGILFYLVITPIGLLMRGFGHDPLRLKFDPAAASYWVKREPPGPEPKSLSNQY